MKRSQKVRKFISDLVADNWHYLVVVFLGLLMTIGVWSGIRGFLVGDDMNFHIARLESAVHGWQDGQIIPQVDPTILGGFGYAYNIFYGPLFTYVLALMRVVCFSWQIAINVFLVLCIVISGVAMCYAMQKISKNKVLAAIGAAIYMAMPYHLVDLYLRGAVGELACFMVAPILLLGLYQFVQNDRKALPKIIVPAIIMVLSHSLSAVLFALMSLIIILLNPKILKVTQAWKRLLIAGGIILGITAFFTLPLLEAKVQGDYAIFDPEYSATYFGTSGEALNKERLPFSKILIGEYQYNSERAQDNLAIGIIPIFGLVGFLLVRSSIKNRSERKFVTDLFIISLVSLCLTSPLMNWNFVPSMLRNIQFPWRFLEIFTLTGSVVTGYVIFELIENRGQTQQQLLTIAIGLLALYPLINVVSFHADQHLGRNENVATNIYNGSIGHQSEYAPITMVCQDPSDMTSCHAKNIYDFIERRGHDIKVVAGVVDLQLLEQHGSHFAIEVSNDSDEMATLELPQIWYPGYQATLNGQNLSVFKTNTGLVGIEVPGHTKGTINSHYGLSLMTKIGMAISGVTIVGVIIWWCLQLKSRRHQL